MSYTYNLLLLIKVITVTKNNLYNQTNMICPKWVKDADSPASMNVHQTEGPLHKQENGGMCSEQLQVHVHVYEYIYNKDDINTYNHVVILFPGNNFKVWKWQIDLYTDHTSAGYYD